MGQNMSSITSVSTGGFVAVLLEEELEDELELLELEGELEDEELLDELDELEGVVVLDELVVLVELELDELLEAFEPEVA